MFPSAAKHLQYKNHCVNVFSFDLCSKNRVLKSFYNPENEILMTIGIFSAIEKQETKILRNFDDLGYHTCYHQSSAKRKARGRFEITSTITP